MSAAAHDDLDMLVNRWAAIRPARHILDVGGATGFRASELAAYGHHVTVLDICDHRQQVQARNAFNALARPPLRFIQADAARLGEQPGVIKQQWNLFNARRVLHWMPFADVVQFIGQLPAIAAPDCHVALCFQTRRQEPGTHAVHKSPSNFFYHHAPQDVLGLMQQAGCKILQHGRDSREGARSYKVFAKL